MTQEGAVPPDFWQQIDRRIDQKVAAAQRAASIRNASISSGGTLSIQGGALVLLDDNGTVLHYIGPVTPNRADGTAQQGWQVYRSDGTTVLKLFDANPTDAGGALQQALNWYDRSVNTVLADDTNSGQGLARPWLSGGFARTRFADLGISTTSPTFETMWEQKIIFQHPKIYAVIKHTMDTSGTTGEVRLMANGVQVGATLSSGFIVKTESPGVAAITADYGSEVFLEIQGRRTSATGSLRVEPLSWVARQT